VLLQRHNGNHADRSTGCGRRSEISAANVQAENVAKAKGKIVTRLFRPIDLRQCRMGNFATRTAASKVDRAMSEATTLRAKAESFRHLAEFIADEAAREDLLTLASEFEMDAIEVETHLSEKSPC
jgi:hypothetical protein